MVGAKLAEHILSGAYRHQGTHFVVFALTGQMNHLGVRKQVLGGSGHSPVHVHRTQGSAGDDHERTVRIDTKLRRGGFTSGGTVMFQIGRQSCDCRTKRQAHAFDFDAPAWFQSWLGVCGTDHGRPTRAQLVGHARTCVLFVNRNRNSHAVRGRVYGCGRVSAETDDHLGLMPGEDVTYFGLLGLPFGWKLQRSLVGPARERHFFDGFQFETGLRNQITLQTDGGAHHRDIRFRFKLANHMRHGEQRIDVACRAATGKNDMLLIAHNPRA